MSGEGSEVVRLVMMERVARWIGRGGGVVLYGGEGSLVGGWQWRRG